MKLYHYFYKITNTKNNKYYYGVHSTYNLNDNYMGSGVIIKKIIKTYGKKYLLKEIIKFFDTAEDMFNYEKSFLTENIINNPNCYNLVGGGNGFTINHYVSDEVKLKISEKAKNKKSVNKGKKFINKNNTNKLINIDEIDKYLSNGWKLGIYYPEESRKKLATYGFKGKKLSEEAKQKISKTHKGKPSKNKGIQISEETRQKLKKINTGKKLSEETKQKIGKAHKGSKRSEETRQKISNANKGHIVSEETRQKISNANKGQKRKLSDKSIKSKIDKLNARKNIYGNRVCFTNGKNNRYIETVFINEFCKNNPEYYKGHTKYNKNLL